MLFIRDGNKLKRYDDNFNFIDEIDLEPIECIEDVFKNIPDDCDKAGLIGILRKVEDYMADIDTKQREYLLYELIKKEAEQKNKYYKALKNILDKFEI